MAWAQHDRIIEELFQERVKLQDEVDHAQMNRVWMAMEGFYLVHERARTCRETCQVEYVLNRAIFASRFQHGLQAGYDHSSRGTPILEVRSFYDTVVTEAEEAFVSYNAHVPSILLQLSAAPEISMEEIKALSSVVDPPSPLS